MRVRVRVGVRGWVLEHAARLWYEDEGRGRLGLGQLLRVRVRVRVKGER